MLWPSIHVLGDLQMFSIAGALVDHCSNSRHLPVAEVITQISISPYIKKCA